jgi:hypothetical protein
VHYIKIIAENSLTIWRKLTIINFKHRRGWVSMRLNIKGKYATRCVSYFDIDCTPLLILFYMTVYSRRQTLSFSYQEECTIANEADNMNRTLA